MVISVEIMVLQDVVPCSLVDMYLPNRKQSHSGRLKCHHLVCSSVLETLIVPQLVKKSHDFYRAKKFVTVFTAARHSHALLL
jgi:hypothetical protein